MLFNSFISLVQVCKPLFHKEIVRPLYTPRPSFACSRVSGGRLGRKNPGIDAVWVRASLSK